MVEHIKNREDAADTEETAANFLHRSFESWSVIEILHAHKMKGDSCIIQNDEAAWLKPQSKAQKTAELCLNEYRR